MNTYFLILVVLLLSFLVLRKTTENIQVKSNYSQIKQDLKVLEYYNNKKDGFTSERLDVAVIVEPREHEFLVPVINNIIDNVPEYTKIQILLYSFLLLACSLLPFAIGSLGIFYFVSASSLGLIFIFLAARLMQDKNNSGAIPFFLYSIIYLTILFVSMILDRLI